MKTISKRGFTKYLLLFLLSLTIAITGACGGGGGTEEPPSQPSGGGGPTTGTISGSVSGTIIIAVNDNGDIVASDDTTGKTPDAFGNYPFTLTGIPTGVNIRVYLITTTGTYPMYFDSNNDSTPDTNVFSLSSAATISLGFVDTNDASQPGKAIPDNDPTDTTGVNAGAENANAPPLNTVSGTYTYNSTTGALTINVTKPSIVCGEQGEVGTYNYSVTTLTATTMVWDGGTADAVTWTRPSGTDGDIVGTWALANVSAIPWFPTVLVTFNADGTFTFIIVNYKCIYAQSSHYIDYLGNEVYSASFYVNDPTQQYTSVTVAGPGITDSLNLTYNNGGWSFSNFFSFGSMPPTPPLTYTFTLNSSSGATVLTDDIEAFVPIATNLSPSGTGVSPTPTFSWTGGGSGYGYWIWVYDSNGNNVWDSGYLTTTPVAYSGPPLTSGATYNYNVATFDTYGNMSWAYESFSVQ